MKRQIVRFLIVKLFCVPQRNTDIEQVFIYLYEKKSPSEMYYKQNNILLCLLMFGLWILLTLKMYN